MSGEMIDLCLSFLSIHCSWTCKRRCLRSEKLNIPHYKIRESKAERERGPARARRKSKGDREEGESCLRFFVTNKSQFQCLDLYVKGYCTFSESLMVLNGRNCLYQIWKGATEIILRQRVEKFNEKVCPILEFLVIHKAKTVVKIMVSCWECTFFGIWHWYIDCLGHLHAAKSTPTLQKEEKTKQ